MMTSGEISPPDARHEGAGGLGSSRSYRLAPILDIRASRQLKSDLSAFVGDTDRLIVDASAVERVSTACVQVLMAFFSIVRSGGEMPVMSNPSRALERAFEDLGISEKLRQWALEK